MKALILAAGFGTRLRPFTNTAPKTLVPVNGIPIILYILAQLKNSGIKDVIVNLHHHGKLIEKFLKNGKQIGMNISYSREPQILGTGGGIKKALRYVVDDCLVINGDVISDFALKDMVRQHKKQKSSITFALYKHPQAKKYGKLYYQGSNLVSILETPKPKKSDKSAMFGSYHIISKSRMQKEFKQHKPHHKFCIIRDVYMPAIQNKKPMGAFALKGFWAVCDSMDDVKATELRLKKTKLSYQATLNRLAKIQLS